MSLTQDQKILVVDLYIKKDILSLMVGRPQIFRKVRNCVSYILIFVASTWLQVEK